MLLLDGQYGVAIRSYQAAYLHYVEVYDQLPRQLVRRILPNAGRATTGQGRPCL